MRTSELHQAVEIIAAAIPDAVDLNDGPRVTQLIVDLAIVAGYLPSEIDCVVDDIVARAKTGRVSRASLRDDFRRAS